MRRGALPRGAAVVGMLAALLLALAACGDTQAGGPSSDGGLVSQGQAEQGAQKWWSDREKALYKRDGTALAQLDADPGALVTLEQYRVALGMQRPLIDKPQAPGAMRVYVPAQQSWPVPVLAVFDLAGAKGTVHLAVLLMARSGDTPLVSLESAVLDVHEPAFDVDSNGYVRMVNASDQGRLLGRSASDLSPSYGTFMSSLGHGASPPAQPPFAPGDHTTGLAAQDAAFIAGAAAHTRGTIGAVDLDYIALNFPTPVFGLKGGGGFTLFAVQRDETLHPVPGEAFSQDPSRQNYGLDLLPGAHQLITMHSIVVVAAKLPPAGAPVQALGAGGGVYSES